MRPHDLPIDRPNELARSIDRSLDRSKTTPRRHRHRKNGAKTIQNDPKTVENGSKTIENGLKTTFVCWFLKPKAIYCHWYCPVSYLLAELSTWNPDYGQGGPKFCYRTYERLYFVPYEKICSKTAACKLFRPSLFRRSLAAIFSLTRIFFRRRADRFRQKIVEIRAILAIFRPFQDFWEFL